MHKVRWRIVLPIVMVVLSGFLTMIADAQQKTLHGGEMGWEVPARTIEGMVNGPGYIFSIRLPVLADTNNPNWTFYYETEVLIGIGVFWFLIGRAIDRRKVIRNLSRRLALLMTILFGLVAAVFGGLSAMVVWNLSEDAGLNWMMLTEHPFQTWRSVALSFAIWSLVLFAYFARRSSAAWKNLRRSPAAV